MITSQRQNHLWCDSGANIQQIWKENKRKTNLWCIGDVKECFVKKIYVNVNLTVILNLINSVIISETEGAHVKYYYYVKIPIKTK